jgi:hypothetical protein
LALLVPVTLVGAPGVDAFTEIVATLDELDK